MVWNRNSKNGTAIACPIIRAELLSFVSMGLLFESFARMLGITIVAPVFLFSAHETETLTETTHTVIKTLPSLLHCQLIGA